MSTEPVRVSRLQALLPWAQNRREPVDPDIARPSGAVEKGLAVLAEGANALDTSSRPSLETGIESAAIASFEGEELAILRSPAGAVAPAADPGRSADFVADLGTTARLISRLSADGSAGSDPGGAIVSVEPLSSEPGNADRFAAGLKDAVRSSGLFYESHLADWVAGTGTRSDLLREPQAAFGSAAAGASAGHASGATAADGHLRLGPQAEHLVRRQLDVLEQRAARWRGEAWPGLAADIRVAEETANAHAGSHAKSRTWQASLRVSTPGLGDLEARILLADRRASLTVRTEVPESMQRLAAGRAELAAAFGGQGLTLSEARIDHGIVARPR